MDEIAFDKTNMQWNDDPFRLSIFDTSRFAKFIVPRMVRKDYPTKQMFRSKESRAKVFRAYKIQVGRGKTRIKRLVPDILSSFSESGGTFVGLSYLALLINYIFLTPIDNLELFFSLQEIEEPSPKERVDEEFAQ